MGFNLTTRHGDDDRFMLAGDWHGQSIWARQKIAEAAAADVKIILHVGDFNIWPGPRGKKFLQEVAAQAEMLDVTILVTPGNHEDWRRLTTLWANPKHRSEQGELEALTLGTSHIRILPRGYRFTLQNVSFLSFGGAASVDFDSRVKDRDWWSEELYSWADVEEVSAGGYADVMITHETPSVAHAVAEVQEIIASNPMGFSSEGLAYSELSRNRLTVALENVRPKLLAHGHMHVAGQRMIQLPGAAHETLVLSLDKDFAPGNTKVIQLEELG